MVYGEVSYGGVGSGHEGGETSRTATLLGHAQIIPLMGHHVAHEPRDRNLGIYLKPDMRSEAPRDLNVAASSRVHLAMWPTYHLAVHVVTSHDSCGLATWCCL